jgi:DNA polymerase-3 subunit gamma/tau
MLSTAAFNALLKTLEEPPSHVVFIMCTTDPQKVPDTIQSRCQRFDFKSISTEIIAARLSAVCELEQIEAEPAALEMIARAARGGMRDALTNLEQMSAFGRGKVDLALTKQLLGTTDSDRLSALLNAVAANDCGACFEQIDKLCSSGVDVGRFASDFATYIRNVYAASLGAADASPEAIDEAGKIGQERLAYMLDEISTTLSDLKSSINPRLIFEMYCVRVCRLKEAGSLAALSARIEALEQKLRQVCEGGVAVSGASAYAAPQVAEGAGANRAQVVAASAQPSAALQQPIAQRAVSEPATNVQPASAGNVLSRTNAGSAGGASTTAGSVGGAQSHKLADVWALVVSDMKSQSQQAGPLLDRARPRFSSVTNTFTIKFVKGDEFYFMAIQSATIVSMLNAALARAYGRQVNLTFEIVDPPANQNTAPAAAPATQSATSAAAPAASSSVAPTSAAESTSSASAAPVETTAAFESIATFGVPVSSTPASGVVSNIQAGVASEQAPMPDAAQVPTSSGDSYDEPLGYAAYDYVPIEDFASASVDEPTSNASAATSASDSAVGASVASDTPDATSGATPDVAEVDWQNNLQEAFGGGIVFEEV